MSNAEELNKILNECCEQLVECSVIIRELPLEPHKKNMYRVGMALAEISEIKSEIYKLHPELKPEKWDEPPSEEDYAEMYEEASKQANEHLKAGIPERAIEAYEAYIFIGPNEKYENMARNAIEKIKSEHRVEKAH